MRNCPVCENKSRSHVWTMEYKIPDGWPLPHAISWHKCNACGMLYGDGDFDQAMLDEYYVKYYGYGVNGPENVKRLKRNANWIAANFNKADCIVDFGGGESVIKQELEAWGFTNVHCVEPGVPSPNNCQLIFASHVIEHIYDLKAAMRNIVSALHPDGVFILDGPDATGLLQHWNMPMLDFNTKHIQHFRLIDYLNLCNHWGLTATDITSYADVRPSYKAPAYQIHFKIGYDVAELSKDHVRHSIYKLAVKLNALGDMPVNVWGLGDITWHLLSYVKPNVLEYIDNDPAYRGQTYDGKPVLERPTNDAPILILAQGQRVRLIDNIRAAGITNRIIEI